MPNKCSNCRLVNFSGAIACVRCQTGLVETANVANGLKLPKTSILSRVVVCFFVCIGLLAGFYFSLVASSKSLTLEKKQAVMRAIAVLESKGFSDEAMLLNKITVFRGDDNWLNASVAKESAYAATNFPFEIMTLYPDFFAYPSDDIERAAILLHEARHLLGKDEKDAYEFVWKNRKQLGWTKAEYWQSPVWQNIRRQTLENAPNLFTCDGHDFRDCTEPPD